MENILNDIMKQSIFDQSSNDNHVNPNFHNYRDSASESQILGICYVPVQEWEQVYDEDTAFSAGTLFPKLNLPFLGGGK